MNFLHRLLACAGLALSVFAGLHGSAGAVTLADQPVFAASDVPGNLALALSVEYPTAISVANLGDYADATEYLGYFDPKKCYAYQANTTTPAQSYFVSAAVAGGASGHRCTGQWSGNFMNWATMQTIDPFRWALSGGFRSVDTSTETVLEKAWGSSQGSDSNFPRRGTGAGSGHLLPTTLVSAVTPFSGNVFNTRIYARGNRMVFGVASGSDYNSNNSPTEFTSATTPGSTFQVYVRVKVCDAAAGGGLEANCIAYRDSYKPEGLLQQYANKIRYSTFAYLNAGGDVQQGAVMRAQMGFIGPTYPQPLSVTVITNPRAEWDAATGIMADKPDVAAADADGVANSGVMNYLNKFGQTAKTYMTYDTVSELYYAALRYFENLGNVPEWTNSVAAGQTNRLTKLDGFPAIADWSGKDPISYSCQKNFILGIGDNNTHFDVNVGGGTLTNSRAKPSAVSADALNKAQTWTRNLETLEGSGVSGRNSAWGNAGSEYIAGLAYGAHVTDIRPDIAGAQNISTYWMDVMEYQQASDRNPYWLAAKYGGFNAPTDYDINNTSTPLTQSWWNTGNETINMNGTTRPRPDNYFLAGNARQMVDGLTKAFLNISNAIKDYTTSFSLSAAQVSSTDGAASFASQYDSKGWTGIVTGSTVTFATDGTPSSAVNWVTSSTMETQLSGTGWDAARNVVTWNPATGAGVPFRTADIAAAQLGALNPSYVAGDDSSNYLDYLRGDRTNETNSTALGSTHAYRARTLLLGDIVDSKVTPVGAPQMIYSDTLNAGYASFKSTWASRPTRVYVGANDGMLHAFNGALSGAGAGTEAFAYIPGGTFSGPSGTPQADGLAQIGNPDYAHKYYVDATAVAYDIDLANAGGTTGTPAWSTVLIGGLGKGGKSFYAINVTDPAAMTSESAVAEKVMWEFSDPTMGFSFGAPTVVKTKKYGWVVVLTSGYNNSDNLGYLYFVHPRTGALLEKVSTGTAAPGLAQASAYVQDFTDGTADAIYVGDLNGRLWRFDVTGTGGWYPAPTVLATAADGGGNAQPITTAPLIEVQPKSKKRYVLFGTGKLLDSSDINSAREQTFYAILDGTATAFDPASGTPVTRDDLTAIANVTTGAAIPSTSKGWYIDLGAESSVGWRLVNNPTAYDGLVAFAPLLTTGDACSPSGISRIYVIDFANGKTALVSGDGYQTLSSSLTDLRFVAVDGKARLVAGNSRGELDKVPFLGATGVGLRLLNWREIPTVD
jgi:type IV pilus assembly protein PilY1